MTQFDLIIVHEMAAMANVTKQREKFAQQQREERKKQGTETTADIIYDIKQLQQQISGKPATMREGLLQYRNELQEIISAQNIIHSLDP